MHALLWCAETGPYGVAQTSQRTLLYMTATLCAWNMQQQPKCWERGGLCTRSATLWGIQGTDTIHDTLFILYAYYIKAETLKERRKEVWTFLTGALRNGSYNTFHIIFFLFLSCTYVFPSNQVITLFFFMTIASLNFWIKLAFFFTCVLKTSMAAFTQSVLDSNHRFDSSVQLV